MVSINDFKTLPFDKKCDFITYWGSYLMTSIISEQKVFLYELGGFYIEVWFSPKHDKVLGINAFKDIDGLTPHLANVQIDEIRALIG